MATLRSTIFSLSLAFASAVALTGTGCDRGEPPVSETEGRLAPLLENIGALEHSVSTSNPLAQRFFDQGLTLYYGFNHLEAVRSFQEAARLDPDCAMCFWGQALAHGPNINDPAPGPEREQAGYAAVREALQRASDASERERAYIDALATRYDDSPEPDRSALNAAYAVAMAQLFERYPDDPDAAVLYAAAIMNTMPWDYWTAEGDPKPGMDVAVSTLESVMASHVNHPGANHYYIHAVEASTDPDRAVPSADRLGGLVPVAGHLVHMPSHIYVRVGRYNDAVESNLRAIAADEDYVTQCRAQGIYPVAYYPHNIHFLWFALSMEGRGAEALESARQVASKHHAEHLQQPGFGFPHLLQTIPLFDAVRFGRWDQALAAPEPAEHAVFGRGIRHFARGMAFVARGELPEAQTELDALRAVAAEPALLELKIFDANSLAQLLAIATETLAGELAAGRGDFDAGVAHLQKSVELEDALTYSEPPDFPLPVRQLLGAVLLDAGRPAEAEAVYREDLEQHRDNGWALYGLWKSLESQDKAAEAVEARGRFEEVWVRADVKLGA